MDNRNEQYFIDKLEKLKEIYSAQNARQNDTSEEAAESLHNIMQEQPPQPFRFARPPLPRPPRPPQGNVPRPLPPVLRPPLPRPPRPIIIPIPLPLRRRIPPRAIQLSKEIYLQIMSLIDTYRELARLAGEDRQTVLRMANQLNQISRDALDIYAELSGDRNDPFRRNIYDPLPQNYCLALRVTLNRVNALYDDVLALQRMINIPSVDRRLIFIASVLQGQVRSLNALLSGCAM